MSYTPLNELEQVSKYRKLTNPDYKYADNDWRLWKAGDKETRYHPITRHYTEDKNILSYENYQKIGEERYKHNAEHYFEYEGEDNPRFNLNIEQHRHISRSREGKTISPYKKEYEFENYLSQKYYGVPLIRDAGPEPEPKPIYKPEPVYTPEPKPEPVYNQPSRTLPDYVDQSPPSYNNERTWQDTSETWKTTGNILGTAGGVYSYFDPVTGALISGVGAGFTGVGNVIDYLTSP
jgi:hypothetical protein